MKVFISGKIGEEVISDPTRKKFDRVERSLLSNGYEVENPVSDSYQIALNISHKSKKPAEIIMFNLHLLSDCDAVYMLDDWDQSSFANLMLDFARIAGKEVWWQDYEDWKVFDNGSDRWVPME